MKAPVFIISLALLAGCSHNDSEDFVQGRIRITPPVQITGFVGMEDGGTKFTQLTDAKGRTFDVYIDYRIETETPGAIYLYDYPGSRKSVRIEDDAAFKEKVGL